MPFSVSLYTFLMKWEDHGIFYYSFHVMERYLNILITRKDAESMVYHDHQDDIC